jgi:hypothetical protein
VHVDEAPLLEKPVDGERQRISHAKDGAERVRTRPQVRDLAQEFHRVTLLLQGVHHRIGAAEDFDPFRLELDALAGRGRSDELACHAHARARRDDVQRFFRDRARLDHHLEVDERAAVVDLDEVHALAVAARLHPAVDGHFDAGLSGQDVAYVTTFLDHRGATA